MFEPHSHSNEQIVWMLKGKMEFRLGSDQRVCGQGDVIVIPGGTSYASRPHIHGGSDEYVYRRSVSDFSRSDLSSACLSSEHLANGHTLSLCRMCDMDTPVHDDTGWESLDFISTWRNDRWRGKLGKLAQEKAR